MMVIEKIATGNPQLPMNKDKKLRKAKRWLTSHDSPDGDIEMDGKSKRGHSGKGGGFYENMGENTGGITFSGQGEGYRKAT